MTSNYKSNGVDIDTILMKTTDDYAIPYDMRNYDSGYWGSSGELYTTGRYSMGVGDGVNRSVFTKTSTPGDWKMLATGQVWGPVPTIAALHRDGSLWVTTTQTQPLYRYDGNTWSHINAKYASNFYHTLNLVRSDGTLWSVGENTDGSLGLGITTAQISVLTQVGTLTDWASVYGKGSSTFAIKKDGTLWAWGTNTYGELGLGDRVHRSSPVQVGSLSNWKQVSSNDGSCTYAVKTDGTLWAWGLNNYGQLGLGDYVHRSSPVQVGSLSNWKQVSGNSYSALMVKTDGTLWVSGYNLNGQTFGVSPITTPLQIGASTNWSYVDSFSSHSLALTTDGTIYVSGNNGIGKLGTNSTTSVNNATTKAVTPINTFTSVACGYYDTSFAIAYS